jgi:predicted transcriptional regulator
MIGLLPKPTLLELDEFDIKQRIIEALTTTCSHAVLFSIVDIEKDAVEISNKLQISLSAVYKTLSNLEKLSLAEIQRFRITNDGKKIKMYRSRIKKANISINENSSEVLLYPNND